MKTPKARRGNAGVGEAVRQKTDAVNSAAAKREPSGGRGSGAPEITAAEALSFLKETKGVVSWTSRDLAETLHLAVKEADQVLAVLELQGYVKPATGKTEWMTTPAGEVVAGSKAPRFSKESVAEALQGLRGRIAALNKDKQAEFRVTAAVAFGDFLGGVRSESARVQAADVGVALLRREPEGRDPNSVPEQGAQRAVLRQLRARSAMLHLRPFEPWMKHRSHRDLL